MAAHSRSGLPLQSSFGKLAISRGEPSDLSGSQGLTRQASVARGKTAYAKPPPFRLPPADPPFDSDYDSNTALWLVNAACLVYSPKDEGENMVKTIWVILFFYF